MYLRIKGKCFLKEGLKRVGYSLRKYIDNVITLSSLKLLNEMKRDLLLAMSSIFCRTVYENHFLWILQFHTRCVWHLKNHATYTHTILYLTFAGFITNELFKNNQTKSNLLLWKKYLNFQNSILHEKDSKYYITKPFEIYK